MKRIFIALWPNADTTAAIWEAIAPWEWPAGCKRYSPADLHITLHFIGGVPESRLPEIRSALRVPFDPFTLTLDTPRRWPGGLAVLCASETPAALVALHDRLADPLHRLALPVSDRRLVPHVTLARRSEGIILPESCTPITWKSRAYSLVVSTGDTRQRYVQIERYAASRRVAGR